MKCPKCGWGSPRCGYSSGPRHQEYICVNPECGIAWEGRPIETLRADAFAACRRMATMFKAARRRWGCRKNCKCTDCAAIKGALTSMAKAQKGAADGR